MLVIDEYIIKAMLRFICCCAPLLPASLRIVAFGLENGRSFSRVLRGRPYHNNSDLRISPMTMALPPKPVSPACHAFLSSQRFTSYTHMSSVADTSASADGNVLAGSGGRMQRCTVPAQLRRARFTLSIHPLLPASQPQKQRSERRM